jgi:hypothetical protein
MTITNYQSRVFNWPPYIRGRTIVPAVPPIILPDDSPNSKIVQALYQINNINFLARTSTNPNIRYIDKLADIGLYPPLQSGNHLLELLNKHVDAVVFDQPIGSLGYYPQRGLPPRVTYTRSAKYNKVVMHINSMYKNDDPAILSAILAPELIHLLQIDNDSYLGIDKDSLHTHSGTNNNPYHLNDPHSMSEDLIGMVYSAIAYDQIIRPKTLMNSADTTTAKIAFRRAEHDYLLFFGPLADHASEDEKVTRISNIIRQMAPCNIISAVQKRTNDETFGKGYWFPISSKVIQKLPQEGSANPFFKPENKIADVDIQNMVGSTLPELICFDALSANTAYNSIIKSCDNLLKIKSAPEVSIYSLYSKHIPTKLCHFTQNIYRKILNKPLEGIPLKFFSNQDTPSQAYYNYLNKYDSLLKQAEKGNFRSALEVPNWDLRIVLENLGLSVFIYLFGGSLGHEVLRRWDIQNPAIVKEEILRKTKTFIPAKFLSNPKLKKASLLLNKWLLSVGIIIYTLVCQFRSHYLDSDRKKFIIDGGREFQKLKMMEPLLSVIDKNPIFEPWFEIKGNFIELKLQMDKCDAVMAKYMDRDIHLNSGKQ